MTIQRANWLSFPVPSAPVSRGRRDRCHVS